MCSFHFLYTSPADVNANLNRILKKFIPSRNVHVRVDNQVEEHSKVNDLAGNHSAQFLLLCSSQVHHPKTTFMFIVNAKS